MNQKIKSTLIIGIMLVSLAITVSPIVKASFHAVKGTLSIDNVIAPAGIEVKIVFNDGGTVNKTTFDYDGEFNYNVGFTGHDTYPYNVGTIYVFYQGEYYTPVENKTVVISPDTYVYYLDLNVDTSLPPPPPNNPPNIPSNPSPANDTINVGLNVDLSWTCSDPDAGDTLTYKVYFGTPVPTLVVTGITTTHYDPGTMSQGTIYQWNIVATDGQGVSTPSSVWSFTTMNQPNRPPNKPINHAPTNGATGVSTTATLSVDVFDPDGDALDVSFYNDAGDSQIGTTQHVSSGTTTSVTWAGRSSSTIYNWYAIASDSVLSNTSDTWSFTTAAQSNPPYNPPSSTYNNPTADANGPYYGFINVAITFDGIGSHDNDEAGSSIEQYDWKFFEGDEWHLNLGANPTHTYTLSGDYTVTLRVTDNEGVTAVDTATVTIKAANNPPEVELLNYTIQGRRNTLYYYTGIATDLDNNSIKYVFNWGDETNTTTGFLPNATSHTANHSWATAGIYWMWIEAYDNYENGTPSGKTYLTVLIDVWKVKDIGYLFDKDSNEDYEIFRNTVEDETYTELQENGTYLIDSDGDNDWDWIYDPTTDTLTTYTTNEGTPQETKTDNTLWYALTIGTILAVILIAIIYLATRKKQKPKK